MKRIKNEGRLEKIEIEEKVVDRNKFEWSVFIVSISVGTTLGCYRSTKNWLE